VTLAPPFPRPAAALAPTLPPSALAIALPRREVALALGRARASPLALPRREVALPRREVALPRREVALPRREVEQGLGEQQLADCPGSEAPPKVNLTSTSNTHFKREATNDLRKLRLLQIDNVFGSHVRHQLRIGSGELCPQLDPCVRVTPND
jgi:hypothetical protein